MAVYPHNTMSLFVTVEQRLYRDALLLELAHRKDFDLVGESALGKETLKHLSWTKASTLIIEESLQDMDGFTIAEIALSKYPSLIVVLLVDNEIPKQRLGLYLDSGIKAVVTKQQSINDLIRSVNYTRNGQVYVDAERYRSLAGRQKNASDSLDGFSLDNFFSLSEREREVAKHIAEHMPLKQIAESLGLSDKTIQTYKERILVKLGFERLPELIVFMQRLKFHLAREKQSE